MTLKTTPTFDAARLGTAELDINYCTPDDKPQYMDIIGAIGASAGGDHGLQGPETNPTQEEISTAISAFFEENLKP
ncbi:MAG: hypothetical protein WAM60_16925 [Candidatus Promineifilaceae bacterium]